MPPKFNISNNIIVIDDDAPTLSTRNFLNGPNPIKKEGPKDEPVESKTSTPISCPDSPELGTPSSISPPTPPKPETTQPPVPSPTTSQAIKRNIDVIDVKLEPAKKKRFEKDYSSIFQSDTHQIYVKNDDSSVFLVKKYRSNDTWVKESDARVYNTKQELAVIALLLPVQHQEKFLLHLNKVSENPAQDSKVKQEKHKNGKNPKNEEEESLKSMLETGIKIVEEQGNAWIHRTKLDLELSFKTIHVNPSMSHQEKLEKLDAIIKNVYQYQSREQVFVAPTTISPPKQGPLPEIKAPAKISKEKPSKPEKKTEKKTPKRNAKSKGSIVESEDSDE